jgi:FAD/FMN-containing dehydrogenase/Fe-S oxidoreductase
MNDLKGLISSLQNSVSGDVEDGKRRRAEYSTDASNYRVVPQVVVFPKNKDDVSAVLEVAKNFSVPLTMRGAGTSIAGNSIGPGIVVDNSRYFNRIIEFDPKNLRARVEPGVIMGDLQKIGAPHGLRFGPDPSTWARCSIGGMIGNNACGPHSLVFGKTSENVISLDVLDGTGKEFLARNDFLMIPGMAEFMAKNTSTIRREFGRFARQISGYSLQHLLPENGANLAQALVGSEGTCVVIQEAEIRLVPIIKDSILVVLGYPDMPSAADDVVSILKFKPAAIEGLDSRLVDAVRISKGQKSVSSLPNGAGWLLIEISGESASEVHERAQRITKESLAVDSKIVTSVLEMKSLWRIREDGVGLAGRTQSNKQTWPGFEDAAVPPENLGNYLREFNNLLLSHGLEGMPYGHFGDGCLHLRIDFPLERKDSGFREFILEGARLVTKFGGSLSGEHGDGRARSELLPMMYSREAIVAMEEFKALFDPMNILNPGIIVNPNSLDLDLRRVQIQEMLRPNGLAFIRDDGDFAKAIHRCVGIGKCRVDNSSSGDFMCPSYLATKDEKDSTRGRARVLQELTNGSLIRDGWNSPEVEESLDLCLSCKACSSDCPAGVDIAAYKAEFLFQKYQGKLRPISHYSLGRLPIFVNMVQPLAPLINKLLSVRSLEKLALFFGGMDTRRSIPKLKRSSNLHTIRKEGAQKVLLWGDTFSSNFSDSILAATKSVLESAGYEVLIPSRRECCGITYISTGQLNLARKTLTHLLDSFTPFAQAGIPIIGIEPSCTAVLRSDLIEFLPDDERSQIVEAMTFTLAEILQMEQPLGADPDWIRPSLKGLEILVQPHCHQHAVMGFESDLKLLLDCGATVTALAGCCGLAGNFGMEKGHFETSVAVAENSFLPALRGLNPEAIFLADGFSCRTQAEQLGGINGVHLAELLAGNLGLPRKV